MAKCMLIARKSDNLLFCDYNEDFTDDSNLSLILQSKRDLLHKFKDKKVNSSISFESNSYISHCKVYENILYVIITKKTYSPKLAFCLLEDINTTFLDEVKKVFGTQADLFSKLETLEKENYFSKYEKVLRKLNTEYENQQSKDNLDRISKEISEVQQIMTENVNLLVDRENIISSVSNMSSTMKDESKLLYDRAKKTRLSLLFRKYALLIAIILIIIVFILIKVYL